MHFCLRRIAIFEKFCWKILKLENIFEKIENILEKFEKI